MMTTNGHSKENVPVEELDVPAEAKGGEKLWSEQLSVAAEDLMDTMRRLFHEANVRRIKVVDKNGKVLLEVPMLLGLGSFALLPTYGAIAAVVALATEHSIVVERVEQA